MANELTLNAQLSYLKNNITITKQVVNLLATVTGNGLESLSAYTATTSDTALPLGSVTSPGGWVFIQNTDATNYVQVRSAVSGTLFAKILPGEFCLLRLDPTVTAPSVQAHTASCVLNYCVFDL